MEQKTWTGKTYGNGWMHRWLIRILKVTDVRLIYAICAVFIVPVCLVKVPSGKVIYRFFRQRFGYSPLKALWKSYVNHCLFSQAVVDKFAMYAGKKFHIELEGYDHYLRLAHQKEGFVQLSSHFGNYEIAGYTLIADEKPFNALVFRGEKESVMENRKKMFADRNIHMIPIQPDMSHLFEIDKVLSDGETLSIPADRVFGSNKKMKVTFLGEGVSLPLGPFSIATMRGLKVISVNVVKISLRGYRIIITPLDYNTDNPRKAQIQELADRYAAELQRLVMQYPAQWYNYFDFWNQ